MINNSVLRSIARQVTPVAMDLYDKEDQASLLARFARIVPNPGREKTGNLEWVAVYPELRKWVDERTVQKAFTGVIPWVGEKYEITYDVDADDAERASTLIKAQDMANSIALAFARGKFELAFRVLRNNLLAYDGQDLFDTDHVHPDGSAYSNLLTIARVDAANPTIYEARDENEAATFQLISNTIIRNRVLRTAVVENSVSVVAKSLAVWRAYNRLLKEERIDGDPNRFKGTFELLLDKAPAAGTENSVDFVWADPDGPRPVMVVNTREPDGLKFDESKIFSHALVPFGMDGEYGTAAGFPQTVVRVKPV